MLPERDRPRLDGKAIGGMLDRSSVSAGTTRFTGCLPRHTFGTEGASAGIPAAALQVLIGH